MQALFTVSGAQQSVCRYPFQVSPSHDGRGQFYTEGYSALVRTRLNFGARFKFCVEMG